MHLQGTFVEGIKEEVVLSPAHALSLIAAGEGEASEVVALNNALVILGGLNYSYICNFWLLESFNHIS